MRKIREVLRLTWLCQLGARETGRCCGISHSTVKEYLRRADEGGLSWSEVEPLSGEAVEHRLFPPSAPLGIPRPLPQWSEIHLELKRRRDVTLQLLWEEYRARFPNGLPSPSRGGVARASVREGGLQ